MDLKAVGQRIKAARETKNLTQEELTASLDMSVYFGKEDIEDGKQVMTVEYHSVEYGKDYDIVNNLNKFQLYVDGKKSKSKKNIQ